MFADRALTIPANRRARAVVQRKNGQAARMGNRLAQAGQSTPLSPSQQLDLADSRDAASFTPSPETPRANRSNTHSFNIASVRYSSPASGDDEEESFQRVFMRQRIYTPSSSRSQRSVNMRASSPEPVTSSPRVISRLPTRAGPSETREIGVSIELIASTRKYRDFAVAYSNGRLMWGNIQHDVAALFTNGEFGLDMFDDVVGEWRQFGLDGSINVLPSQSVVLGRVVHAHALLLDAIEIPSTDDDRRPVPMNLNGKRPAFPPLKMGPRPGKKAKTH